MELFNPGSVGSDAVPELTEKGNTVMFVSRCAQSAPRFQLSPFPVCLQDVYKMQKSTSHPERVSRSHNVMVTCGHAPQDVRTVATWAEARRPWRSMRILKDGDSQNIWNSLRSECTAPNLKWEKQHLKQRNKTNKQKRKGHPLADFFLVVWSCSRYLQNRIITAGSESPLPSHLYSYACSINTITKQPMLWLERTWEKLPLKQ